jgi:hypothetical protein
MAKSWIASVNFAHRSAVVLKLVSWRVSFPWLLFLHDSFPLSQTKCLLADRWTYRLAERRTHKANLLWDRRTDAWAEVRNAIHHFSHQTTKQFTGAPWKLHWCVDKEVGFSYPLVPPPHSINLSCNYFEEILFRHLHASAPLPATYSQPLWW